MRKIVIAQFWDENTPHVKYTKLINEKYCNEKGYIYHLETDVSKIKNKIGDRDIFWYKPLFVLELFETYQPDYVLFLDNNAVVLNHEFTIDPYLDSNAHFEITKETKDPNVVNYDVINTGVFIVKNSEWSKWFLQSWYKLCYENNFSNGNIDYYKDLLWPDQLCLSQLIETEVKSEDKIKLGIWDTHSMIDWMFKEVANQHMNANKNFIFHAYYYTQFTNKLLDRVYEKLFNIPKQNVIEIMDYANNYETDKHHWHRYFELVYNELLTPLREQCKTFIEIGIWNGPSVQLWRDYFINAEIVGIELNMPYSLEKLENVSKDRMTLLQLDQSKEEDMIKLSEMYPVADVIMDDGSHWMGHQQMTFAKLFKSVKPGGIYVIEDLHTSWEVRIPDHFRHWTEDKSKTLTLDMVRNFKSTGKIYSDYMTEEEMEYLNNNIESFEIYQTRDSSITSVAIKKM